MRNEREKETNESERKAKQCAKLFDIFPTFNFIIIFIVHLLLSMHFHFNQSIAVFFRWVFFTFFFFLVFSSCCGCYSYRQVSTLITASSLVSLPMGVSCVVWLLLLLVFVIQVIVLVVTVAVGAVIMVRVH